MSDNGWVILLLCFEMVYKKPSELTAEVIVESVKKDAVRIKRPRFDNQKQNE